VKLGEVKGFYATLKIKSHLLHSYLSATRKRKGNACPVSKQDGANNQHFREIQNVGSYQPDYSAPHPFIFTTVGT
jgi:hypothetical protein